MQAENQVTSPNNTSLFAWVKVIKKKFLRSFPEIKTRALLLLHENISKEFEKLVVKQNRTRARAFYEILRELYLHLSWKIDWNIECHIKSTCVLILYYMSYTGLILSKGNVSSEWFSQTFTAFHFLSGDPFLVCDALLLFQNMKKKYHHAYSKILKAWLFDENLRKPSDYESFVKVMLLFRRLKSLSKGPATRSKIMCYALKVQCPPGIESWLSTLKIKDLCNIKSNKIVQHFLKKDLSCCAVKKLQKILFANKYDARFINSHRNASIQQNTTKTKKIKKKFNKKPDKVKEKSNTLAYNLEIDLNNEINSKNSKNHSDYQCFSPAKISFNEKNSTHVSALSENPTCTLAMPKRKFSGEEEIGKTCLFSVSPKSKKKKIYTNNKMSDKYKEYNSKHSIQLNGKISDHSDTDSVNEVKGENITSVFIVDSKNVSKEADKQTYSDTPEQFFLCLSKSNDLQSYGVEKESLLACNMEEEKQESDNLSLSIEPCKLKRNITENFYENGNDLKFATPIVFRKDRTLAIQRTNKHCENSLAIQNTEALIINSLSSTDLVKNNIDFSPTDKSNLLSIELQGQEIMQTDISENNVPDVHKNNLEILTKNDHIPSNDVHIENRPFDLHPKICNKAESDCESKLVNYSFCANNTKLIISDHSQASVTQSKEVQDSAESPIIISPSKSHSSQETYGNCFELYSAESTRNQDTRLVSMLSSPFKKSSRTMYSSPESLELSIVSCPTASFSIENSLDLSKSIYSTTDPSLTTEDELHMSEEKCSPTKLFQLNSKAITSKMSKSKLSTKRSRRKRVKSRKYVNSSSSSSNENSLKLEATKTMSNSNCEVERFSDVLESKIKDESSNKRSSLQLSNKKERITDSTKHKVDHSEKRKQMLQLTSKCEIDLSSNHLVEEENKMPCLEHINVSNLPKVNEKSSELHTEESKSLSTVQDNVTQNMHLSQSVFAENKGSVLPADNSTKNLNPVCTFETIDLLHSTSKNKLQQCLPELNNLPAHKSVHKQLENSKGVQKNVSSLGKQLLESVSDNKSDFANGLRTSSPVQVKKSCNGVHNSKKINSDFPPPLQNEQFSQDYENNNVKVNNSEMPLNKSLAVIPDQESFPEVQDVQIVLTDSLSSQGYPVSPSSKSVIENLFSPRKEKNASFDSTSKLKNIGKQKKRKFVSDSDSDALEDQKSMEDKCFSKSGFKKSIDLSKEQKLPSKAKYKSCLVDSDSDASIHENELFDSTISQEFPSQKEIKHKDITLESASQDNSDHSELPLAKSKEQKLPSKVKYERCFVDSDSDESIHENGLPDSTISQESPSQKEIKHKDITLESASQDNSDHSELPLAKSKEQKLPSKVKYKRCFVDSDSDESIHDNGLHDSTVSQESPSQKEIKHKDIESASEDNSDHSELPSNCSSPKLKYSKVNPKDFISEYAYEDNDYHSGCSSEFSEVSHNSFIVDSATEDCDSDSDASTHENGLHDSIVSQESMCLSSSSHSRSFENDDGKNVTIEAETQGNVSNLISLSRSPSPELKPSKKVKCRTSYFESSSEDDAVSSPKLKPSYKVKAKRYVLESESEDNANESMTPSRGLSSDFIPYSKIKSKTLVLKSASEESADDSEVFSRSQCLELKHHNKVKSQVLVSTKDNANLISSSSHLPLLGTNSITALKTDFDPSHDLNASPIKQKSKYLLRSSSIRKGHEKSFSEIKKSMISNKLKEIDSINSKNSLVNLSSRKMRKHSETKEVDENSIIPLKRRGRRKSKKIVSESESDSFDNQYDHENKWDHSNNISSKNLAASNNHLTNPSRNSNLNTNVQINCRTESINSVEGEKNLDVSKIHVDSSTNQTFSAVNNKSNVFRKKTSSHKCVQKELSFESESSSDDIPLVEIQKKLKTSVILPVSPGNPNPFINLDKALLKVSSDCIQNSETDSCVLKHSPISETCSVHQKENLELSKTSQNSGFISDEEGKEVSLKESSFKSTSDLLGNGMKKQNSEFTQENHKVLELQTNLQLQATKESLPTVKQLRNSLVESPLEQSFVNNLNICSSEKGSMFPKTLSNLNNLPPSKQENNSSPRGENGYTGHQLSEIDKNVCDLFFSEKEQLAKDSFHDTNYLSDENLVQTLFDKIDPNILNNEDYLNTFVDNYLISSTQTALNENIENSDCLNSFNTNGSHFNSAIPYSNTLVNISNHQNTEPIFSSATPHSNTVNKSDQQNSELISSATPYSNINKSDQQNSEPIFSSATPYSDIVDKSDQQNSEPIFSSATTYSNTVNKSNQQNSESIFSPSNNETFDFHIREGNVIDSKIMEFDAVNVQNIYKNNCLNSNLDPNQILEENNSQQSPIQLGNSCNNTELQQLDLGITPTERINATKRSDIFIKQNQDSLCNLSSLIKIPTHSSNYTENKEMVKPPFCEMDFEKTSPDRLNIISLNSETLLEKHQKDVSYSSKLKLLHQDHSSNCRVNPILNTSVQIMPAHLNNTADTNEKILFICDIESKTCQVHIMPQQLMVTFLSKMGNVSQNHTLCSNSTKCNCPLCCYSSLSEFKDDELSKDSNNTRTEMGHICVNGVKLLTSSLFPVVNLGKRCDEEEIKQNSSKEIDSAISTSNKVSIRKQSSVKKQCLVKSNSKSIVPENRQKIVRETRRNSSCKKENDSAVLKKESIPKRSYNLRTKKKEISV